MGGFSLAGGDRACLPVGEGSPCHGGSSWQGGSPWQRGVSLLGGVLPAGVSPCQGGPPCWGVLPARGSPCRGVLPARGGSLLETPPWTESQTPVKTSPWPNFVAAGNNRLVSVPLWGWRSLGKCHWKCYIIAIVGGHGHKFLWSYFSSCAKEFLQKKRLCLP